MRGKQKRKTVRSSLSCPVLSLAVSRETPPPPPTESVCLLLAFFLLFSMRPRPHTHIFLCFSLSLSHRFVHVFGSCSTLLRRSRGAATKKNWHRCFFFGFFFKSNQFSRAKFQTPPPLLVEPLFYLKIFDLTSLIFFLIASFLRSGWRPGPAPFCPPPSHMCAICEREAIRFMIRSFFIRFLLFFVWFQPVL